MHDDSGEPAELSDADLIASARGGDDAAADALFRRHRDAARRFARRLTDESRADDLVSEAFTRVLVVLRRGDGPDLALRPYLLATIRNAHISWLRGEQRIVWVDDHADISLEPGTGDETDERIESNLLVHAFRSLPERWQTVLWHTAVEGDDHEAVGRMLGLAPNAVGALAFRAREGLRRAYLEAHLATATDEACRKVRSRLPGYVRGGGGARQRRAVEDHLATCRVCSAAVLEAQALNDRLGALLAPALLGIAYAGQHVSPVVAAGTGPGLDRLPGSHQRAAIAAAAAAVLVVLTGLGTWALVAGGEETSAGDGTAAGTSAQPDVHPDPTEPPAGPVGSETAGPTRTARPPVPTSTPSNLPEPAPTSAPPSEESTPAGSPEPTSSPDPHHPPGTDGPSTPPDPDPDPSDEPSDGWTGEDLRLTQGYQSDFGDYYHVQMRPQSTFESTYVRLHVPHLVGWTVHAESGYRSATCLDAPGGDGTEIVCRVGSGDGLLGLDLRVDGPLDVLAEVYSDENDDPHPANNVLGIADPDD